MKHNNRIGILGGGQLGMMLMEAGQPMDISYNVVESGQDFPSKKLNINQHIDGTLYEEWAIEKLAEISDILTFEIEHLNVDKLCEFKDKVIPKPEILQTIQDKGLQKEYYLKNNISTLPFVLASKSDLIQKIGDWGEEDLVLKHRMGGYDGKGVLVTNKKYCIENLEHDVFFDSKNGFVLESSIKNARELSVIVAIDTYGNIDTYEISEMVFNPMANLMDYLVSPADLNDEIASRAKKLAENAVKCFGSPGIFAVELFLSTKFELFVNEIAPRPHNSGHHTIESCYTSQYQQLNRILMGYPLGSTFQHSVALTANILGPENLDGTYHIQNLSECLGLKGVFVHMYGKKETKAFRKLGHFTVIGNSIDECIGTMHLVKRMLQIVASK